MTVADLIEYLKTLPDQDAIVLVCKKVEVGSGYMSYTGVEEVPLSIEHEKYLVEHTDWSRFDFIREDHEFFGRKTILLGSSDS